MSPAVVRWQFSLATTRSLRLLIYAAVGLTVGPILGFVCLLGTTLVRGGGVGIALLGLALALVVGLGVGSGRALFALGKVPSEVHESVHALSRWGVVASVVGGMGLGLSSLLWTDFGVTVLGGSLLAGFAALVVSAGLRTEGVVDCEARELTYYGHTIPLDAVRQVYARRLGPFVFAVFAYHRGRVGPSMPRFVVLSAAGAEAVSAGVAGDKRTTKTATRASREIRAIAAVFGLGCLAIGPILWMILPADGRLFAGYLGIFGLLFGVLFVRYALVA